MPLPRGYRYQKFVDMGMCPICARRPAQDGHTQCRRCREQRRLQSKRHYAKYRVKYQAMAREKYQAKRAQQPVKPSAPVEPILPPMPSKDWLRARIELLEGKLSEAGIAV